MLRPIITLTTDFGTDSPYVAQMKAAILAIARDATIVDITHAIPPQDIRQGAFVLAQTAPRFPAGAVHVAVVDPGVGTERAILCARVQHGAYYIAPDNGLLTRVIPASVHVSVIQLTRREFWSPHVSNTFHGRDIMAPVAAHLSLGVPLERLGESFPRMKRLDLPAARVEGDRIEGQVTAIDSFGNLITNVSAETLVSFAGGADLIVRLPGDSISGLSATYGDRAPGALAALIGSSGLLEIAVVRGSAARSLGVSVGERLVVFRAGP